jgi:hypothetical protein
MKVRQSILAAPCAPSAPSSIRRPRPQSALTLRRDLGQSLAVLMVFANRAY